MSLLLAGLLASSGALMHCTVHQTSSEMAKGLLSRSSRVIAVERSQEGPRPPRASVAESAALPPPPRGSSGFGAGIGLRAEADSAVAARGTHEHALLQPGEPLVATKQRRGGASAGGFGAQGGKDARGAKDGSGGKSGKAGKAGKAGASAGAVRGRPRSASTLFDEMQRNGVVRIDGALRPDTVTQLRAAVDSERARAEAEVEDGGAFDRTDRFADLVLLENRCDLLMPLRGAVVTALHELLGDGAVLGDLLEELVGEQGVFNELACLISEPGARQQPLHPDTPWTPRPPLYAAFVALQATAANPLWPGCPAARISSPPATPASGGQCRAAATPTPDTHTHLTQARTRAHSPITSRTHPSTLRRRLRDCRRLAAGLYPPHAYLPHFPPSQDIDLDMGPTIFLPGTHTKEAHTAFYGGFLEAGRDKMGLRIPPIPEDFLRSCPVRLSTLRAGDVALYNQQVLHCGSANRSPDRVRRQFYVSFRDATVANVEARASIRPALRGKLTLGEVRAELRGRKAGGGGVFEALDAADADADITREVRIANGGRRAGSSNGPRPIDIF